MESASSPNIIKNIHPSGCIFPYKLAIILSLTFFYAFGNNTEADLLLTFTRQHLPEELAEIEKKYSSIFTSRHKKIEEKKILLLAQAKKEGTDI